MIIQKIKNRASQNGQHGSSNYTTNYILYSRQKLELDVLLKQRFLLFSKNLNLVRVDIWSNSSTPLELLTDELLMKTFRKYDLILK